ncbi:class II aldolase/adducin family protein [Microbacterium sp. P02]|uniref:class II aldolase/adducin family protein n=1 Tax=Microbacterium sp. P02 TaxID=3366260 RepID=UPI0036724076
MTLIDDLIAACRALADAGLSPGSSGNASVRDGDIVYATRSGSSLRRVTSDDLAVIGLDGAHISGPPVTKEIGMHLAAYRARPDTGAVVHLHSRAATAVSCLDSGDADPIPAYTPYRIRLLGRVAVVPYAPPGSVALTMGVAERIAHAHVLLLANHGSLVRAEDAATAVDLCEELESAADLALALAGRRARTLDPASAWGSSE